MQIPGLFFRCSLQYNFILRYLNFRSSKFLSISKYFCSFYMTYLMLRHLKNLYNLGLQNTLFLQTNKYESVLSAGASALKFMLLFLGPWFGKEQATSSIKLQTARSTSDYVRSCSLFLRQSLQLSPLSALKISKARTVL